MFSTVTPLPPPWVDCTFPISFGLARLHDIPFSCFLSMLSWNALLYGMSVRRLSLFCFLCGSLGMRLSSARPRFY